jgi:hypothetical protein
MQKWASILGLLVGCIPVPTPARDIPDPNASDADASVAAPGGGTSPTGGPCRTDNDCNSPGDRCHEPYTGGGGGGDVPPACMHRCESDQNCGSTGRYVCVISHGCSPYTFPYSYGDGGERISDMRDCGPRCQESACRIIGETCLPDGHCVPTPCGQDGDCLPNFTCGAQGSCARRACRGDGECQGACVRGLCYPTPGACGPLAR